jgi:hypothetical protein
MPAVRVIGPGRAGGALARRSVAWLAGAPRARRPRPGGPGHGPVDRHARRAIAACARAWNRSHRPWSRTCGIARARRAGRSPASSTLHLLLALPSAEVGAARLAGGAWFAVAGDELAERVVHDLGGRSFVVADADRAAYHAAACIASNHLVALLGQVERVAATVGVPMEAYLDLVRGTVENVAALGPRAALTGPAARGDDVTLERHREALAGLDALGAHEVVVYDAMVEAARRLVARTPPAGGAAAGPAPGSERAVMLRRASSSRAGPWIVLIVLAPSCSASSCS